MEKDILWKTTFDERRPSMQANLVMEGKPWLKMTFDGRHLELRQPNEQHRFGETWPLMEDYLRLNPTFDGILPMNKQQQQEPFSYLLTFDVWSNCQNPNPYSTQP